MADRLCVLSCHVLRRPDGHSLGIVAMELLRQFDFDKLESVLAEMLGDGFSRKQLAYAWACYMICDDGGQPGWMSAVDGYYRLAAEEKDENERAYLIHQAHLILQARNGVM